jgi:hypothetical protein
MISLHYYESIFNKNQEKLNQIKQLLLNDFKKMEQAFFEADVTKNLKLMRNELHKMNPIVSNLGFTELSVLLEKYRTLNEYDESIQALNSELKTHLNSIYSFLN